MDKKNLSKNYIIKSDLLYRKHNKVRPFYAYILLLILNYIPKKWIALIKKILHPLKLRCSFKILDRELKFYIDSNSYDFKYHGGFIHELRISENILRLVPNDAVFFDIGCAVGWYSILLSEKCKKIFGFDPYDNSSVANVRLNKIDNFELFPYFISNRKDSGKIAITTIDDLIEKGFLRPDLIKIDIEGAELDALTGAKKLFETFPPKIILVEAHSEKLFYECVRFLESFHYRVYNLGCPKINTGGDIYPLSYELGTESFATKSEVRMIMGIKINKV
jgi:hypothetical protein